MMDGPLPGHSTASTTEGKPMQRNGTDGDLGSVLAVFAHPDDEAYLAGALMAEAADAGRPVVCVTATRGELGFPDDDHRTLDERASVREAELEACLELLGVKDHRWLNYRDGGCAAVPADEGAEALRAIVDEVQPDTVLTFGPDGQTYHQDHIAISRWTTYATRRAAHRARLLYATVTPEWNDEFTKIVPMDQVMMVPDAVTPSTEPDELAVWFVAKGPALDRKVAALRCQASQTEVFVQMAGYDTYARLVADEFYREPAPGDWPE
jgi:LmbE family N-acetylglucosaminyl deacetylase